MKGNNIDELFRNGLESHKTAAPESVWSRLEAELPQENKKGAYFWLSIAASIVLLATIGWLAFNNKNSSGGFNKEVLSNKPAQVDESTKAKNTQQPEEIIPSQEPEEKDEIVEPVQDKVSALPRLVAQNDLKQPANLTEEAQEAIEAVSDDFSLKIEMIRPAALKPQYLVRNSASFNYSINNQTLMDGILLTEDEYRAMEQEGKKKFGFLNSIVSVARGVNNGTKALSEIRKSKNEFITNDLKYGAKTDATTEGSEDGPEFKQ